MLLALGSVVLAVAAVVVLGVLLFTGGDDSGTTVPANPGEAPGFVPNGSDQHLYNRAPGYVPNGSDQRFYNRAPGLHDFQ